MLKYFDNYKYLGMEDLPQEILIEHYSINVVFINNRTRQMTAGAYIVHVTEIVSDCRQLPI